MAAELELRVTTAHELATDVRGIELRPLDGELPEWQPGAHIDVHLPEGLVRQYSLCGDPERADSWRIAVLREPEGRGGSRVMHEQLSPGMTLPVSLPRNNFPLEPARSYLFVAGGIGITPILPMVRAVAARGAAWTLLYGGRTRASMAFLEELERLEGGELLVRPQDEYGLLDLERRDDDAETAVYCCGPPPLLEAVSRRWPHARQERFTPVEPAGDGSFQVRLARSGKVLTVPEHAALLDVLEEAGYEPDSSCRAGICGTCLLGVLDGEPEHYDDVLDDDERNSGQVILPCVSRAKTGFLVLDL